MPAAAPAPEQAADALLQSATWQPASGLRARWVEGAVIIASCAYFMLGLVNMIHAI